MLGPVHTGRIKATRGKGAWSDAPTLAVGTTVAVVAGVGAGRAGEGRGRRRRLLQQDGRGGGGCGADARVNDRGRLVLVDVGGRRRQRRRLLLLWRRLRCQKGLGWQVQRADRHRIGLLGASRHTRQRRSAAAYPLYADNMATGGGDGVPPNAPSSWRQLHTGRRARGHSGRCGRPPARSLGQRGVVRRAPHSRTNNRVKRRSALLCYGGGGILDACPPSGSRRL